MPTTTMPLVAPVAAPSRARFGRAKSAAGRSLRAPDAGSWQWVAIACVFVAVVHAMFLSMPLGIDAGGVSLIGHRLFESHEHGASLYGDLWIDRPPLVILIFGAADMAGGTVGVRLAGMIAAISIVVVSVIAVRRLEYKEATRIVAMIAALLAASPALGIHGVPQELVAAPFTAGAVACLLPAIRGIRVGWWTWFAAGSLAMGAILVKQSFIDGIVVTAAIAALAAFSARIRVRAVFTLGLGAAIPVAILLIWASMDGPGISAMWYAMFGFRLDGARALAGASVGLSHRFQMLGAGSLAAGLPILLPAAVLGIRSLRRTHGVAAGVVGAAWLCAGLIGVAGGGYYWTHYMIQLIPTLAVLGGIGLYTRRSALGTRISLLVCMSLVAGASIFAYSSGILNVHQYRAASAASYLRANAAPRDRLLVMYARANLVRDSGMTPAFPYQWSLMYRAKPNVEAQMRTLLSSPHRPTWVAAYQRSTAFELDRSGRTLQLLDQFYRTTAIICGTPILIRRDDLRQTITPTTGRCPAA